MQQNFPTDNEPRKNLREPGDIQNVTERDVLPKHLTPTSPDLVYPVSSSSKHVPVRVPSEKVAVSHQAANGAAQRKSRQSGSGVLGGMYFLAASAALMFGFWFIGPRLVEEYHYAAALGKARAEYDNAVEKLSSQPLTNVSQAYQLVAHKVKPSVVSVSAVKRPSEGSGLGSGVVMSTDGYILTNAHVLDGASKYIVELPDRRHYTAKLIGADLVSDLALLKINAPGLIPADWGNSDEAEVGSIVWAVGSPYGFQQTVTSGILSGKDRPGDKRQFKQNLLQTDAAVNPGNSGGPLVDSQGRVIGINTSIFGETFQGISFAVPSKTAIFVYNELKEDGRVTRGYLGAVPDAVSFYDSQRFQLPDLNGAKLTSVRRGSPAYRAGIRRNDVIRSWNGTEIKEFRKLYRMAEMTEPYTTVKVTLYRDGLEQQTQVTVGEFPETDE